MKRILSLLLIAALFFSLTACDKACEEISLKKDEITLTEEGDTYKLKVTLDPKDTTDELEFESDDEDIATVDEDGVITAVSEGETTITVTCGDESEECDVICDFDASAEDVGENDDDNDEDLCDLCSGDGICDYCDGDAICPTCYGLKQCLTCAGIGKIDCDDCDSYSDSCYSCDNRKYFLCSNCDGSGVCPTCNDEGVLCDKCDLGFCPDCYEG